MLGYKLLWKLTLCLFALAVTCADASAALTIDFDYSHDQNGFFDDPMRRDILELAAGQVNRFIDDSDPIVPSGDDTWTYYLILPDSPNHILVENDSIAADTVKIYAGGKIGMASRVLAEGSAASIWTVFGSQQWKDTVNYRGKPGAAETPPTANPVFAGSIAFNMGRDWHTARTTDGISEDNTDLLTVATHELLHVLGYGPAASWKAQVSDGRFIGPQATAVGSSNNPELQLDGVRAHWDVDTLSDLDQQPQVALMSPYITRNERRWLTTLDRAALRDVGWTEAAPGDVDRDRDVDALDVQAIQSAAKFGVGPSNATWADGDFDGNQKVDGVDIQMVLSGDLFNEGPYAATDPDEHQDEAVRLLLDPARRSLTLDTDGVPINGYVIASAEGIFSGAEADNLGQFIEDDDLRISGGFGFALDGVHPLGRVIGDENTAVDPLEDLTFTYTVEGTAGTFVGRLVVVPEPATFIMLAGGVLCLTSLLWRRQTARTVRRCRGPFRKR